MSQVRSGRVAVVAAMLVALYVTVAYTIVRVPDWAVGLFGGAAKPIDRMGGLRIDYRTPDGTVQHLEYPGLAEEAASEITDLLVYGGLVMRESLETEYATRIGESEGVTLDVDQWRPEDGNSLHTVTYLYSHSFERLQQAVQGAELPSDAEIVFEKLDGSYDGSIPGPYWRTHLLAKEVLIDATMIASAMKSFDPYSNRPIVLLDFTRDGGDRFCAITERIQGKKLATVLGGRVRSAPIINGRICGGRASVTMGGNDPAAQEREADALVSVLRSGVVPPGGTLEKHTWSPPADVSRAEWMARIAFGLVAGIALGLLVFAVLRFARPTRVTRPAPVDGKFPWRRLIVTLLAPAALIAGANLTLPFVNDIELAHVMRREVGESESVIALGLTPVIVAFLLVELVALLVPRLRWRRHDPLGRVRLGQATAILAIVLALLQGYTTASYYASLGRGLFGFGGGAEVMMDTGLHVDLIMMITLAAGTSLLVLVAGIIREHGLGNGYAALIASSFLIDSVRSYAQEGIENIPAYVKMTAGPTLAGVIGAVAIALATRALLRWRITSGDRDAALRVPTSGIAPLGESVAIVLLVLMLSSIGSMLTNSDSIFSVLDTVNRVKTSVPLNVAIVLLSIPLWAWLLARPTLVERVALQGGVDRPRWPAWTRAMAISVVAIGALGILGIHALGVDQWTAALVIPLDVMLLTAALLDIVDDARARRRKLVPAGVIHQVQYIGVLERVLQDAGIPAHFHASNVRTLFAFFGPWAPVTILVPEEFGEAARAKVDDVLRAPRGKVPEVRVVESA